jgi:N-acetylglucosamine malate deacetylase 2
MYEDPAGLRTPEVRRKRNSRSVRRTVHAGLDASPSAVKTFLLLPREFEAVPQRPSKIIKAQGIDPAFAGAAEIEAEVTRLLESQRPANSPAELWPRPQQAPFAVVRNTRAERFRLPRPLKSELIDRFCAEPEELPQVAPRTLIVVAHQDDESIGAGARLCQLTNAHIVHVTDGAPRDPAVARRYGYSTREEYAEARRAELLKALAVAGVPRSQLIELGFVDGEASLRLVELCLRLIDVMDVLMPEVVITHPYEGGHTDHDATAFAVHLACGILRREGKRPPAVLELTSYFNLNGQKVVQDFLPHDRADRGRRIILLNEQEQQLKRRMFACFSSQQGVLQHFNLGFEKFRPAPRYVFTQPPHAGPLNYERYGNPRRGAFWRKQAEQALRALRLRKR